MSIREDIHIFTKDNLKKINIEFKDIRYSVRFGNIRTQKVEILHGVSGKFMAGEMTAIMGPSGCGKSSLINILTGFVTEGMSGKVMSNGLVRRNKRSTFRKTKGSFNKQTAYILQDDNLWPQFTVNEIMNIATNLKISDCLKHNEKQVLIFDILDTLGLSMTRDTMCERLSGGQRKRLSIALELIDNPSVLFLDEPTTGLDSKSTTTCISVLKRLAERGQTIICVIHQPTAALISQFDHLYVLAKGNCVYQGSSDNLLPFLCSIGVPCPEYHNPADFILDVASGEYGDCTEQINLALSEKCWRKPYILVKDSSKFKENEETAKNKDQKRSPLRITRPSEFQTFCILLKRQLMQLYRQWASLAMKLIMNIIVGIVFGLNYEEVGYDASRTIKNLAYFFCTLTFCFYTVMMPSALHFPLQIKLLRREEFNNWYRLRTYYITTMTIFIPLQIFLAVLHVSISYILTKQPLDISRYIMFVIPVVTSSLWGETFALIISTMCDSILAILFWCSLYMAFILIFSGFLLLFADIPAYLNWLGYFSAFRYLMQSAVLSQYDYDRGKLFCPEDEIYCHLRDPQTIMKELGCQPGAYWINMSIIITAIVVLRIMTYFTLKKCITRNFV